VTNGQDNMSTARRGAVPMRIAPHTLSGTVYGTLLNHRSALAELGEQLARAPYNSPPKAPVLYIKPRNTLAAHGDAVVVPEDSPELEVGGCVGLVIGQPACRLSLQDALEAVAGYVIVNDISVPHASFHRPSIRFKARDGFCPIGPHVTPRSEIADPDALTTRVFIDGVLHQATSTADLVRPVARLLADVTEFMTLFPGDVLAVGVARPIPHARAGQTVVVEVDGLGRLENRLVGNLP
jgi:5-oxopent-3-ene-1,2,5-tricarboxylate decarboxylase / 2-hydroxyhepta-2,4-diene-1,7-dioate isomerase